MQRSFKPPRTTRERSIICLSSDSDEATNVKISVVTRRRQKNNPSPPSPYDGPSTSSSQDSSSFALPRRGRAQTFLEESQREPQEKQKTGGVAETSSKQKNTVNQPSDVCSGRPHRKRARESSSDSERSKTPKPPTRHSPRIPKPILNLASPSRSPSRELSGKPSNSLPTRRHSTRAVVHPPLKHFGANGKPVTITGRMSLSSCVVPETPSSSSQPPKITDGPPPVCVLCDRSDVDKVRYFRMDSQGDLYAHYLCMFTASNLHQTGDPRSKAKKQEICGFLCESVRKERIRARKLVCKYCKKRGAAVGCAVGKCSATYHYPCGLEKGCYFQFSGTFESYCPSHIPKGRIPRPKDMANVNKQCSICFEEPDLNDKMEALVTPCCNRALHRECVSNLAVNSGKHYLKCPSCNKAEGFKAFCAQVGVHVPNADATWLADEEAEQAREDAEEEDPVACVANEQCMCPNGVQFDEDVPGRDWNIERCSNGCGTFMHAACMKHVGTKGADRQNFCFTCFDLEMKINKQLGRTGGSGQSGRDGHYEPSPEIPERPMSQRIRNNLQRTHNPG